MPDSYYRVMNNQDDKLRALLKQWGDIEPRTGFEANVWRRIRQAQAAEPERVTIAEWFRRGWWQPAWAVTAAVTVSVVIGTAAGLRTAPQPATTARQEMGFLSAGTLAGGYAKLASNPVRPVTEGGNR